MQHIQPEKLLPFDRPATYQIIVQGRIDPGWSDCLEGMSMRQISTKAGSPVNSLEGEITDQVALAGVMNVLYEQHLTVLSVTRLDT